MTALKLIHKLALLPVACILLTNANGAENLILTDVQKEITKKLATKPGARKMKVTETIETVCGGGPGRRIPCSSPVEKMSYPVEIKSAGMRDATPMCFEPRCVDKIVRKESIAIEPLTATNGRVTQVSQMQVMEAQTIQFPPKTFIKQAEKINCSKTEKSKINENFSFTSQSTVSTQVRKGVSSTVGVNARVDYKLPMGFGTSVGASVSQTTSLDRTDSQSSTTTINYTSQILEDVPPMTRTRVDLILFETSLEVPFIGSVIVDGDLDANMDEKRQASQILSESERTIEVNGVLAVTASTLSKSRRNDFPATSQDCDDVEKGLAPAYVIRDMNYVGTGFNTLTTTPQDIADRNKRNGLQPKGAKPQIRFKAFATPGSMCYMGPCDSPPNGYREICFADDDGACTVCTSESDAVCEPISEQRQILKR